MDEDKNVLQLIKIKAKLIACPHDFLLERHNKIRYHEKQKGQLQWSQAKNTF